MRREILSGGTYTCRLQSEISVEDLELDITKPIFEDHISIEPEKSLTLSTIVDGSTTKEPGFGSEVIVYLELELAPGFQLGIQDSINS